MLAISFQSLRELLVPAHCDMVNILVTLIVCFIHQALSKVSQLTSVLQISLDVPLHDAAFIQSRTLLQLVCGRLSSHMS